MKLVTSLLLLASAAVALAEPPKIHSPSRYNDVFKKSAFTDPPPKPDEIEVVSDLPDWTLVGVSKLSNEWSVTLLNTKNREERVTVPSLTAKEMGFSILEVKHNPNYLKTEVRVKKGSADGWVVFDPQFLVLRSVGGPVGKGKAAKNGRKTPSKAGGRNGRKTVVPPTPGRRTVPPAPGARRGAPPAPGSRTRGNTSTNSRTKSKSTKNSRTRYVPRPNKKK